MNYAYLTALPSNSKIKKERVSTPNIVPEEVILEEVIF